MSCLILGLSNLKVGIDVYLESSINELKKLWSDVLTYDVSRKQNFMMKATLMWTTSLLMACCLVEGLM